MLKRFKTFKVSRKSYLLQLIINFSPNRMCNILQ